MGDKIVIQMRYIHQEYVEFEVDDPDKCSVLDVFVEMLEGAEKNGMILPENPSLWYAHDCENFRFDSDEYVVKMMTLFSEKRLIKLAIGSSDSPCRNLELGRGLIDSKKPVERSSYGSQTAYSKKVPATTAGRKGTFVSKSQSQSTRSEPTSGEASRTNEVVVEAVSPEIDLVDADFVNDDVDNVVLTANDDNVPTPTNDNALVSASTYECGGTADIGGNDSETDDYFDRIYDNGELYGDTSIGNIKLKVWMLFFYKEAFTNVLRDYCVQEGFSVVVVKADQIRYTAVCGQSECGWRIHASRLVDGMTWAIMSLTDTHSCLKLTKFKSMATPEWVAKKLIDHVRADDDIKGPTMQSLLLTRYGINMKSTSLYKARTLALAIINGKPDASFGSLAGYCEVVKSSNPGSRADIVWGHAENDPERPLQFKNVFIAMKPMIEGVIHGCRGLIGVDGCHLKGKYGGVVLAAVAVDGENEIFPLAYGVYENESKRTRSSFFYHLREVLRPADRANWCIISDRQKGVEPALAEVWPTAGRRYCCTHLLANFKKKFPGLVVKGVFWECCKAFSEHKFKKSMEKVERVVGTDALNWLKDLGEFHTWARFRYDPSLHAPHNSSNFVESFNSTLGADRCLPVLSLLEGIRRTMVVRHCKRQEDAKKFPVNGITDYANKRLAKAVTTARALQIIKASPTEYEVTEGSSALAVDIKACTCGCGEWQIRGIPCRHAVRAIIESRGHPEHYVSNWYSIRVYKQTYSANYRPVPDEEQWPSFDLPRVQPPTMKRRVGRPAKTRRRQEGEAPACKRSRLVQCGRCQAYGHNVKTCEGGPTAKEVKAQKGIRVERRSKRSKPNEPNIPAQGQIVEEVRSSAPWVAETQ